MTEKTEISQHEIEVFRILLARQDKWSSNALLATQVKGVAPRTVRAMTLKFVRLGILDQAEVFPSHRFRLSEMASKRNRGYLDRLYTAAEVFDVKLPSINGQ